MKKIVPLPRSQPMDFLEEFNLPERKESPTEADLLLELSQRIASLLQGNAEFLFSLLYRMDVSETKVAQALRLDAPDPAPLGLAKLVLERQHERNRTMETYKQNKIEGLDEELEY